MRRKYNPHRISNRYQRTHPAQGGEESYKKIHSKWGLIINTVTLAGVLLGSFAAFWAYNETKKQTSAAIASSNASVSSAAYADSVFKATKEYNKKTLALTRQKDSLDSIDNRLRHLKESASLAAQIKSIDQGQEQFLINTEPYLQVSIAKFELVDAAPIKFEYEILNLSPRLVEQKGLWVSLVVIQRRDSLSFMKNPYKSLNKIARVNRYISTGPQFPHTFTSKGTSPVGTLDAFRHKEILVLFLGKIEYVNYTNRKPRKHEFVVSMEYDRNNNISLVRYLNINNEDIPRFSR